MSIQPFAPYAAATANITVSGSSQRVLLGTSVPAIRIMNNGSGTVWVNFGDVTVTATTGTGMPVGPGVTEVIKYEGNGSAVYAAAVAADATGIIYFTPGLGF